MLPDLSPGARFFALLLKLLWHVEASAGLTYLVTGKSLIFLGNDVCVCDWNMLCCHCSCQLDANNIRGVSCAAMHPQRLIPPTELERETGLSKDLLRTWRLRYGFPVPVEGEGGNGFTKEQVAQLRIIKRLLDSGFRPALIVGKPLATLISLADVVSCRAGCTETSPIIREALGLLEKVDVAGLENLLLRERQARSLTDFVVETVAPLTGALGEAWSKGEIDVYHEHLCTGALTRRLYAEIAACTPGVGYPRFLFATPPDEMHALGMLMAQAVLADHGAHCISVGAHVPLGDLEMAATACKADVLALSFSFSYPKRRVRPFLVHLRSLLPPGIEIWAGGAGVADIARPPKGVRVFSDLRQAIIALSGMLVKAA
jgi:MerR family transcriptional regulator, light-induced transcriptional regulator